MIRDLLLAPNQLTLMRLVFVPFILMSVLEGHWRAALILFVLAGISDGLDGLLARRLGQSSILGQYLDPIADKLLLSGLFLVLSLVHRIPWRFTVMVFSRDIFLVVTAALLYMVLNYSDFRPSIFGKANTAAQVAALFVILLNQVRPTPVTQMLGHILLWLVFTLTLFSGLHYIILTGQRMRRPESQPSGATR